MVDEDQVAAIVRSRLSDEEATKAIVRWDTTPKRAGEALRFGPRQYEMPFDGYFVFVDLVPLANWSHPARVVLIGRDDGSVETLDVSFPPFPDAAYPPRFRLVELFAAPG
jgi:hypothetical protein